MLSKDSRTVVLIGVIGGALTIILGATQMADNFFGGPSALEAAELEDKLHENLVTRIKNMGVLIDTCNIRDSEKMNILDKLKTALNETTIHKNFETAEQILEDIGILMKSCDAHAALSNKSNAMQDTDFDSIDPVTFHDFDFDEFDSDGIPTMGENWTDILINIKPLPDTSQDDSP